MAAIKVIPASENKPKTLRVAAYCRVSSDSADQLIPTPRKSAIIRKSYGNTTIGNLWTCTPTRG